VKYPTGEYLTDATEPENKALEIIIR